MLKNSLYSLRRSFSLRATLPVINLDRYRTCPSENMEEIVKLTRAFKKYSAVIINDSRYSPSINDEFLDVMEVYFKKRRKEYLEGKPLLDCYPEIDYQIGLRPENCTTPDGEFKNFKNSLVGHDRAMTSEIPSPERFWRYMWRIDDHTVKKDINYLKEQSEPEIPGFSQTLNSAGAAMVASMRTVSEMLEIGLGLREGDLTNRIKTGNHMLSPVGTCLNAYACRDKTISSFHKDLNYITVHGKCRYPGLIIWLPNGKRIPVFTPPGSMIMQVGSCLEYLTGGYFKAGYHEVIFSKELMRIYQEKMLTNSEQWRIATVLFSGLDYSTILEPIGSLRTNDNLKKYPRISTYDYVRLRLNE